MWGFPTKCSIIRPIVVRQSIYQKNIYRSWLVCKLVKILKFEKILFIFICESATPKICLPRGVIVENIFSCLFRLCNGQNISFNSTKNLQNTINYWLINFTRGSLLANNIWNIFTLWIWAIDLGWEC